MLLNIRMIIAGTLFWLVSCLATLLSLFFCLIFLFTSLFGWIITFFSSKDIENTWINRNNLLVAESNYFKASFPPDCKLDHLILPITIRGKNYTIHAHFIDRRPQEINKENDNYDELVLIHGVGSSALLFSYHMIPQLPKNKRILVIDIPGFGRSNIFTESGKPSKILEKLKQNEVFEFYDQFFSMFFRELALKRPVIIAHSIGAFLITKASILLSSPQKPIALMLVNPAGVYPIWHPYGAYWGVFFWLGLPMSIFRYSTFLTSFIYYGTIKPFFIGINKESLKQKYWIQLQSSEYMVNIPEKFIEQRFLKSCWTAPLLDSLLTCQVPIKLIWSEKDNIMPIAKGEIVEYITSQTARPIKLTIIKNAGHTPYLYDNALPFIQAINENLEELKIPLKSILNSGVKIVNPQEILVTFKDRWASFSPHVSHMYLSDFYDSLKQIVKD